MDYHRYNEDLDYIGVTNTEPIDSLWTNDPPPSPYYKLKRDVLLEVWYEDITISELAAILLEQEYLLMIKYQQDGMEAFLKVAAKLRRQLLDNVITTPQLDAIEDALEPFRNSLVLGQWPQARRKLIIIGSGIIGVARYNELLLLVDDYIALNY